MTDQNAVTVSSETLTLFRKMALDELESAADTLSSDAMCWYAIRRLTLEAKIRDCGWWGDDSPERRPPDRAPASFTLTDSGTAALIELLPEIIESTREDIGSEDAEWARDALERTRALQSLAVRLGAEAVDADVYDAVPT